MQITKILNSDSALHQKPAISLYFHYDYLLSATSTIIQLGGALTVACIR